MKKAKALYFPEGTVWSASWELVTHSLPEPAFAVIGLCQVFVDGELHSVPSPVELVVGVGDNGPENTWLNVNDEPTIVSHWMEFPPPPVFDYEGFYNAIPAQPGL